MVIGKGKGKETKKATPPSREPVSVASQRKRKSTADKDAPQTATPDAHATLVGKAVDAAGYEEDRSADGTVLPIVIQSAAAADQRGNAVKQPVRKEKKRGTMQVCILHTCTPLPTNIDDTNGLPPCFPPPQWQDTLFTSSPGEH